VEVFDRIDTVKLDRRELQLWVLAITMILVLAIGMALLMYPTAFLEPVVLAGSTLRKAFFGFCALSLLIVGYLIDRHFMIRQLRHHLAEQRNLQEQLTAARDELQQQATRDSLSGVLNRAGIMNVLERELARADRMHTALAIVMLDIDHFKKINDTYGHLAGDAVLRETARRLSSVVRRSDAIGRYGGDEFLTVLSGCDEPGAVTFAEKLRVLIEQKGINTSEGVLRITLSVGVAVGRGALLAQPAGLIRAADAALYEAKASGRNRVELAKADEPERRAPARFPAKDNPSFEENS
jgi:diguanylate cyclase (GGDEF)-like protein